MKLLNYTSIFCFLLILFTACKSNTQSTATDGAYINSIEIMDLEALQQKENVILLDVRTQGEIDKGTIPGMIHIDYNGNDFAGEIAKLDKNKEYIVYCQSGMRSTRACKLMSDQGFTKLNNLTGGYKAYNKANN